MHFTVPIGHVTTATLPAFREFISICIICMNLLMTLRSASTADTNLMRERPGWVRMQFGYDPDGAVDRPWGEVAGARDIMAPPVFLRAWGGFPGVKAAGE
jgi:hypothetical protein